MARFVLIDHSLKGVGGHHYEYAVHMLRAAEAAGYEVVLAANRRFRDRHTLPGRWHALKLFRHHTYCRYSINDDRRNRPVDLHRSGGTPTGVPWFRRPARRWHRCMQRRRIRHFAAACARLFHHVDLRRGDHVFVPTLSEFDLLGLAEFLQADCRSLAADWHLQFHFNFLDGRPPDYRHQEDRIAALRQHFAETLSGIPDHRLHFYSTTAQMADQYNRLEVAPFQVLPYPVNPVHRGRRSTGRRGLPLRVTCAGGVRTEKGQQELQPLVHALWDELFTSGRVQLLVQSKRSRFRITKPGGGTGNLSMGRWPLATDAALVDVPHPLDIDGYARLIRGSDIGLFLYDSRRYYARCAGILVEMLRAGVPVIVPAGCWLAEQIAEPTYAHLDRLLEGLPEMGRCQGGAGNMPAAGGWRRTAATAGPVLTFAAAGEAATGDVAIPPGATDLLLSFDWLRPAEAGTYVRLRARQFDAGGTPLGAFANMVVGRRARGRPVRTLVRVHRHAAQLSLRLCNAYHEGPITIGDLDLRFLSAAARPGGSCPAGAVGLTAADIRQVPELLREMVAHYPHYAHTAAAFSQRWGRDHDPARSVAILTANGAGAESQHGAAHAA